MNRPDFDVIARRALQLPTLDEEHEQWFRRFTYAELEMLYEFGAFTQIDLQVIFKCKPRLAKMLIMFNSSVKSIYRVGEQERRGYPLYEVPYIEVLKGWAREGEPRLAPAFVGGV